MSPRVRASGYVEAIYIYNVSCCVRSNPVAVYNFLFFVRLFLTAQSELLETVSCAIVVY